MRSDAGKHFVASWLALCNITSVPGVWGDGTGDDVSVDAG
jgi:hypothetical protein